jgi:hypothetical protein
MDFHMAAIERYLPRRVGIAGDRRKYRLPNTAFAPACEAIVDRLVRTVFARAILPPATNTLNMHDAAQNPPIIIALRAGLVGRQMRFDFRPLLVAKPKQARIHGWPPNRLTNPLNQHMVN